MKLTQAARHGVGALAGLGLAATMVALAPPAAGATSTTTVAPAKTASSCGITYVQRAGVMKRTITYTNNCASTTLCIKIKTWGGPWWNVETSPRITVPAGATGGWRWAKGRNNWNVYYVNCR